MTDSFPTPALLDWFSTNQRSLPWRKKYEPYEVWLSEVLAQQTRIDQMIPYYDAFLQKFPTVEKLANASYKDVLKSWEGLGYYSRAKNLHDAAQQIMKQHDGKIPQTKKELEELKGFGPYISSAVASIAFNENVPVVDGNVLRVMARVWGKTDDIALPKTRELFQQELQAIIPNGKARFFNQGLMEIGALICTPANPACFSCPLQSHCVAYQTGQTATLPVKSKKAKAPTKHFAAAVIQDKGSFWLMKRSEKLLSEMWEFPMVEYLPLQDSRSGLEKSFYQKTGFHLEIGKEKGLVRHQYTHFNQIVHIFESKQVVENFNPLGEWQSMAQIKKIPLPKVQHKILAQAQKEQA